VLPNANRIPTVTARRHHPNAPNHFPTGSGYLNLFFLRVFAPSREISSGCRMLQSVPAFHACSETVHVLFSLAGGLKSWTTFSQT
jgi:hypothetical protein